MDSLPGYPEAYLARRGESSKVIKSPGRQYQPEREKKRGKIVRRN